MRLLVWRQYHWADEHQKQKLNLHFKVVGRETSLKPGRSTRHMVPRIADWEGALESGSWRDTQWRRRCPIHSVPDRFPQRI